MDAFHWWRQGDAVTQGTALLLLGMSVASWVVIVWKLRLLRRARADVARCVAAVWQAPSLPEAALRLQGFDRLALVLPMVAAVNSVANQASPTALACMGSLSQRLTRVLRDALHAVLGRLQFGQVLLATVGSTAPFVGLLGTVVGVINAFTGIAATGSGGIGAVSAGIAEALVETALGLVVAIPAVWFYNYLTSRLEYFNVEMDNSSSELVDYFIKKTA